MSQFETNCSRESPQACPSQCFNEPADSPSSEQFEVLNILPSGNNATSSIDIDNIAISNNGTRHMQRHTNCDYQDVRLEKSQCIWGRIR